MTIFLYGQDAYRLKQGLGQVVAGYKKKYPNGLNLFSFDLSDNEQKGRFEDSLKTASLFEEAKLIITRNVFASKDSSGWAKKILFEHGIGKNKEIVVAVVEPATQKELEKTNKELFKDLASTSATVRNFEYLDGVKLVNWVRSEFASLNCSIDTVSARTLVGLTGNESWQLANEIQKLANYRSRPEGRGSSIASQSGQKVAITSQDIRTLVSGRTELNIFNFVDAIVSKNRAKSYELLYRELKNGRDPHYLLAMMAYGFRSRANKFSLEELRSAFGKLLEMDTLSKNGAINLVDTLFEFVIV